MTPADAALEIREALVTAGVCQLCCRIAMDSVSFVRAAEILLKAASLGISDERLRQMVQGEGQWVQRAAECEQLMLNFDVHDCVAAAPDGQQVTRVCLGCDGVKVPVISDVEKGKRFEKAVQRRKRLPRRKGVHRARLIRRKGADDRFKEFKIVTYYDQSRAHCLVSVTRKDHRHAARLMRRGAAVLKVEQAQERAAIVDGASWIASRIKDSAVPVKEVCLDFYHLSENVHKARREVFGEEGATGHAWADRLMHGVRYEGYQAMWEQLCQTHCDHRGKRQRAAIVKLMNYLAERQEMIRYPEFERRGGDIGSGPTESQCKATTRRIKGRGARWEPKNAEAMMSLEALYQSGAWDKWWSTRHLIRA